MPWNGARPRLGAGEHGDDTWRAASRRRVDRGDQSVSHLRTDEDHVERIVEVEVADVFRGAEQQLGIFSAQHTCTENRTSHGGTLSVVVSRRSNQHDGVSGRGDLEPTSR